MLRFVLLVICCSVEASDPTARMLEGMGAEMWSACQRGACHRHSNTSLEITNTTDCLSRMLAYEFGLKLLPARAPQRDTFDALELQSCGVTPPVPSTADNLQRNLPKQQVFHKAFSIFVDVIHGSDTAGKGTIDSPVKTIPFGLSLLQKLPAGGRDSRMLIMRAGVYFLDQTIVLGVADSGLTLTSYDNEQVWISGGMALSPKWKKDPLWPDPKANVYVTDVPKDIPTIKGLTTVEPHRRAILAREPNCDPELSKGACWHAQEDITSWYHDLSCVGQATVVYKDLRDCQPGGVLPDGSPCKADSAMWDTYNTYANGYGGCCEVWAGDWSPYGRMGSYYCGNSSAGGWVGDQDPRGDNSTQGLSPLLPQGFDYNSSSKGGKALHQLGNLKGGILNVWRAQGWYMNMFELGSHDTKAASILFARRKDGNVKGGWQGGRGWQVDNASAINTTHGNYLTAGGWSLQNVKAALDAPNEWWFDSAQRCLYYWPNSTTEPPDAAVQLVAVWLNTLISINETMAKPARDIVLRGLQFRDAGDISMEPWGVPSGGDWGLHRGGAVFIEGCEGCTVEASSFARLDGNAIMLSGYTRNISLTDNSFEWLGHNAMAAWGYTNEQDGTDGQQPRSTLVARNYVREIGIIQKQSSMWFQAKSCQNTIVDNVVFNGPRAAINLNDGFGGANVISNNLIFNQCRESGDHGPINSWDRQPFITDVAYGTPSYDAGFTSVDHNFIIANYGSSQGFDTDDGSSWYDIHHNFMFDADGWKDDYGGHDSRFTDNIVYVGVQNDQKDGQNCFNSWSVLSNHGSVWANNTCILLHSKRIGEVDGCECPGPNLKPPNTQCGLLLGGNRYYSRTDGRFGTLNVSVQCGGDKDIFFDEFQSKHGSDSGSMLFEMPSDDFLFYAVRKLLGLPLPPGPAPVEPAPLPPVPPPYYPPTCEGQCEKAGYCCSGLVSGCSTPSCAQGCALANATADVDDCKQACQAAQGHCTYKAKNVSIEMCGVCPPGCGNCEGVPQCEAGCEFARLLTQGKRWIK